MTRVKRITRHALKSPENIENRIAQKISDTQALRKKTATLENNETASLRKLRNQTNRTKAPAQSVTSKKDTLHKQQIENNAVHIPKTRSQQRSANTTTQTVTSSVKIVKKPVNNKRPQTRNLSINNVEDKNETVNSNKNTRVKPIKVPVDSVQEQHVGNNAAQISTRVSLRSNRKATQTLKKPVQIREQEKEATTSSLDTTNNNNTVKNAAVEVEKSNKIFSCKSKQINAENLAGKHSAIEEFLNSIEDVDCIETEPVKVKATKKQNEIPNKKQVVSYAKRPTYVRRSKLYDFSLESFEEESDPAADIIKKLIKDKKVRVATYNKGRPRLKKSRKSERIKAKTTKAVNNNIDVQTQTKAKVIPQPQVISSALLKNKAQNHKSSKNSPNVADGTFSNLARSVLLHETNKKNSPAKQFLNQNAAMQNVISTPLKNNSAEHSPPVFSPIPRLSNKSMLARRQNQQATSPWRVDSNAHLPQQFYISFNSEHLATFSSDIINKPDNHIEVLSKTTDIATNAALSKTTDASTNAVLNKTTDASTNAVLNKTTDTATNAALSKITDESTNTHSSSSSCSTNDSNVENIPPPLSSTLIKENNDNVLNFREQTNVGNTLGKRSPLKALNIIDVMNLPNWKPIEKDNLIRNQKSTSLVPTKQDNTENCISNSALFGFEEFLDDEENNEDNEIQDSVCIANQNETLREKLHQLQKWRPTVADNVSNLNSSTITGDLFGGAEENSIKQRCIKQMLCSTMVNPKAHLPAQQFAHNNTVLTKKRNSLFDDDNDETSTTFENTVGHRTYERPFKRKRKLRQNLVMYFDSDESGEEEHHEQEHKAKKQRKERVNPELEEFAQQFNSMCDEVQHFELMIE